MQHILIDLIETLEAGSICIIASVVKSAGSAPRTAGARMLVKENGNISGSIGGGAVEGSCISTAVSMLQNNEPDGLREFDLKPDDAAELGMVCGGAVTVLLQRSSVDDLPLFRKLHEQYIGAGRPVLLTRFPETEGTAFTLLEDEDVTLKQKIEFEFQQQKRKASFLYEAGEERIFVEPLVHPGTVHLMGAGHVAQATGKLAHFAHFDVVVADDRQKFANTERFPEARVVTVLEKFENCFPSGLGGDDYLVIVTRGHVHDRDVLAEALKTEAGYIGMIGSSRKIRGVFDSLLKSGFSQQDLDRVHSPIGLSIGANTPEEIAVSIVAELIQARAAK